MTIDTAVIPGLLLLAAELVVLAAVGYVVVRVALRQTDERVALAQGLVVGLALWGLIVNFVQFVTPGLAGAAVSWVITLCLGALLARRSSDSIRPPARVVAGFLVAWLAVFWVALASRQTLGIPDPQTHLGAAAAFRAGVFPPEISWSPGIPVRYHYGVDLVVGLLAPPVGPDFAFVLEILGAHFWTSLALIVAVALQRRGGWLAVAVLAPLLITAGAWTWHGAGQGVRTVLTILLPLPADFSPAGLASVGEAYWPTSPSSLPAYGSALPDIWIPSFTWAYALAVVVLDRATENREGGWGAQLTLAGLVGFLGLVQTAVVPVVLTLWAGVETVRLVRLWRGGANLGQQALRPGVSLALAAVLLLVGGGVFTGLLDGRTSEGLVIVQRARPALRLVLGSLSYASDGPGLLAAVGPLVVAGIAAVLGRRDRLVHVLALGACMFTLVWMVLDYAPAPFDWGRVAGHGRYFALAALVLALGGSLAQLPARWRYGAVALLVLLLVWPSIARPARVLAMSLANGVDVANAAAVPTDGASDSKLVDRLRNAMPDISPQVLRYIWNDTPNDARIFTSGGHAAGVTMHTGRPNASGLVGHFHLVHFDGPEQQDVRHYLEPGAVQRMGIHYIHATDNWVSALPKRAQAWLADPRLFEELVNDGNERLFRVRPAFLQLDAPPTPASFEALRRAIPPTATVYFVLPPTAPETLRIASTLSHARILGEANPLYIYLMPPVKWRVDRLTDETPDLVVLPTGAGAWMFEPSAREPIWWHDSAAIHAPTSAYSQLMDAPVSGDPPPAKPPVLVKVTDVTVANGRIEFRAAFDERASQGWTSQDWVVLEGDRSPWAIPTEVFRLGRDPVVASWFAGLLSAGGASTSHIYRFDARTPELLVRNDAGDFVPLAKTGRSLEPGGYTLALRLRHEYQPNHWRDASRIPVLRFRISETGEPAYEVLQDVLDGRPLP